MRFINDDVKLKQGGRNAAKVSQDELWSKIVARAKHIGEDIEDSEDTGPDGDNAYEFIRELIYCDENIRKDIKYNVDAENILTGCDAGYEDKYVGLHTLSNGLTFYGILMGGDWEDPVFIIIYWDGKKLRAYIPSYGNRVNLDCKCAFGSESDDLDDDKADKLLKKYKKLGIEPDDPDYVDWSELYCKLYDTMPDDCDINYNAIIQDIQSRIIIA